MEKMLTMITPNELWIAVSVVVVITSAYTAIVKLLLDNGLLKMERRITEEGTKRFADKEVTNREFQEIRKVLEHKV